ncbi:hypothetical protein KY289_001552 [Solanum tuberosum]|nr:hypothetical protein KY289_001552 [Solanum tuberosum]
MQLSYDNLTDCLKPCLLYMGMFPEDAIISVSKLISLWIAEGFVQNIESGRLMEETVEGYLMDLIQSSVVMVFMREHSGKVKYCQVHDVVLHFCLQKSRKEKFMLSVKGNRSQFEPCDWNESRVSFILSEELFKSAIPGSKTLKPFAQHLRTLITIKDGESIFGIPFFQIHKLRLVKVLDLSSHEVHYLSSALLKPLNHLKYLAVSTREFYFHPQSHLSHLETLIIKNDRRNTVLLQASFWETEKLRHVDIRTAEFDLEEDNQRISCKLENLRILKNITRFPIEQVKYDDSANSYGLTLENFTQLQILRLSFKWHYIDIVSRLQLPSNIKKLVLGGTPTENMFPFTAGLSSLEYLQLKDVYSTQSKEWCLGDLTFPNLKFLKLSVLGISRLDASEESFPRLETLVIRNCNRLEEIPLSFEDILTLKQIKLIDCNNESLEASAVRIKEDVEENEGNNRIELIIKRRWERI